MKRFIEIAIGVLLIAFVVSFVSYLILTRPKHAQAPAPAPDFGCTQTISSTDARRIASDLHRYSSEGDSVEFYFECQDRFTVIRLERVR